MRKSRAYFLVIAISLASIVLEGCAGISAADIKTQSVLHTGVTQVTAEQFVTISKNGVEIACPMDWSPSSDSDPRMVYEVSRSSNIRLTVAIMDALPATYYDGLVNQGAVQKTVIAGNTAYQNELTYPYGNYQLTNECITIVHQGKACHVMFLCDTGLRDSLQPVLQHVLDSIQFS
jgi:hypothetical protein